MIHFLYLVGFALFVSIVFAVLHNGTVKDRVRFGIKNFVQFVVISLVLAWILYFIPW